MASRYIDMAPVEEVSTPRPTYLWAALAVTMGTLATLAWGAAPQQVNLNVATVQTPTMRPVAQVSHTVPSTSGSHSRYQAAAPATVAGVVATHTMMQLPLQQNQAPSFTPAAPLGWAAVFATVASVVGLFHQYQRSYAMAAYTSERTPLGGRMQVRLQATEGAASGGNTNILIFGPNGSGKGTQGTLIKNRFEGMAHIESGAIFREHIGGGTELGLKAKEYIDRGDLVPDEITIPMILSTLKSKGGNGWLLDGFPRSIVQAEKLWEALQADGIKLDYVVEIMLDRQIAKDRIMGRRLCVADNNHPNNVGIPAIAPDGDKCRVCGGELSARSDDMDEAAIGKRHDIYYDTVTGTVAAANFYKDLGAQGALKYIQLDGAGSIADVKDTLISALANA